MKESQEQLSAGRCAILRECFSTVLPGLEGALRPLAIEPDDCPL